MLKFDIEADELQVFLEEVDEHLQAMETGVLSLEHGPEGDTLQIIFRAAHTLKALAGTIQHLPMAELTHTLENLFEAMREGRLWPERPVIDELLTTVDTLKTLRNEIVTLEPSGLDVASLITRLRNLLAARTGQVSPVSAGTNPVANPLTSEQAVQVRKYLQDGYQLLEVKVVPCTESFAPAGRLAQAAMALLEVGVVVAQQPSMAELAKGHHQNILTAIVATTAEIGTVEKGLADITDLATYIVQPYLLPGQSTLAEPIKDKPPIAPAANLTPVPTNDNKGSNPDKTVRISVERLDNLMNLVGELVKDHTHLLQIERTLSQQYGQEGDVGPLNELATRVGRVVNQLQHEVMKARMLPIANLFSKFPRLIRDVAQIGGKQATLLITGEGTELDRSLIEVIGDPLIHLLRNAVDHGLETPAERQAAGKSPAGTIRLSASHEDGQIVIIVQDDGRGINPARLRNAAVKRGLLTKEEADQLSNEEAIDLIFLPTLSTAEQVTKISGRGVGMDVVRSNIERLNGSIQVESIAGQGTTFRLTLPLTLAIMPTMLVKVGEGSYALPLANIVESIYLRDARINTVKGSPTLYYRDTVLPLLDLRQCFADSAQLQETGQNGRRSDSARLIQPERTTGLSCQALPAVVIVTWNKLRVGFIVDSIIGHQAVVVKSLSPVIGSVPGLSGGAILGDGQITLIVDVAGLINWTSSAKR